MMDLETQVFVEDNDFDLVNCSELRKIAEGKYILIHDFFQVLFSSINFLKKGFLAFKDGKELNFMEGENVK